MCCFAHTYYDRSALPLGNTWMLLSSVDMPQNKAAASVGANEKMPSCLQLQPTWPHRAALIPHCVTRLTTNSTNIAHNVFYQHNTLTLFHYFWLYSEKGCSLDYGYMADNKLSFPLWPLSLKYRVHRSESVRFSITLWKWSPVTPLTQVVGCMRSGKPAVPFKKYVGKKHSRSPICLECFMVTHVTPTEPTSLETNNVSVLLTTKRLIRSETNYHRTQHGFTAKHIETQATSRPLKSSVFLTISNCLESILKSQSLVQPFIISGVLWYIIFTPHPAFTDGILSCITCVSGTGHEPPK